MIYLDNSATTPLSDSVKRRITEVMEQYGNPSSLHPLGQSAEAVVEEARTRVLRALGLRPRSTEGRLFFTSSGTEATALAIFGSAYAKKRRSALRILCTDSEHPSVLRAMDRLSEDGFEIVKIPTHGGVLDMNALKNALDKPILLASFMLVNNETGAVYSVAEAFRAVKRVCPDALCHCDAVQGFMKLPFTPAALSSDMITVSAHKIHAPKGVGALYVSEAVLKAKKLIPFLVGGGQESGMRSGTENVLGIAAFGEAAEELRLSRESTRKTVEELRVYADEKLSSLPLRINCPEGDFLPNIINITLPNVKSETMLHALSADGICVSSGSACSSHAKTPSGALIAFGLSPEEADCSLRISLSHYNTKEEIDALCASLEKNLDRLVRIRR
ncbi:MAG: cysteine desulfurase [Clostridia bacterium]|nr:cysteine desulfurase [Clostridia bacterium]